MNTTEKPYDKPLPEMDPEERPFWESARAHMLKVQRCDDCTKWCFPPRALCPHCMSDNLVWAPVTGRATVYASTTQHHPILSVYTNDDLPYNISLVELEEGVRLVTNVIGCTVEEVTIGLPVEVTYVDVTDEITLPRFKPRAQG